MKNKILSVITVLVLMATLPLVMVKCGSSSKSIAASATPDTDIVPEKADIICGAVAAQADNSFCEETLKVLIIILNSNYTYNRSSIDTSDSSQYTDFKALNNSNSELYSKIKSAYNSLSELYIAYNSCVCSVPYSVSSNGATLSDDNLSYITSVASPWDCYSEHYKEDLNCYGVSISGVDYLCRNGSTCEEALQWYLPLCKISQQNENP